MLWPFLENIISQHSSPTPIPSLNNLSQLIEVIPSLWPSIPSRIGRPKPCEVMGFKRRLFRISGKEKQVSPPRCEQENTCPGCVTYDYNGKVDHGIKR